MYLFSASRHGVSAKELQRQLGVTYKTAWRIANEIRKYTAKVDDEHPLDGEVQIDETYVGRKRPGKRGLGAEGKAIVFGMLEREGDVMTKVVPNVRKRISSLSSKRTSSPEALSTPMNSLPTWACQRRVSP